ncbi:MAG: flagellar motor stator protein MotA [Verrucomicrobium sp.]|jgi:chemotaxis protein MotA|nr:flagellar motor stator protein MotA [Verrucomicrobium sp.]
MLIIIGSVVVLVSVLGGFMVAGGNPLVLLQWSEFIVILGAAFGSLITMAPMKIHKDLMAQITGSLKGSRYTKAAYEDMFKALYEMFMLGRRNGMVALEPHIGEPATSSILTKYSGFSSDHHAVELLTGALRPLIDGKIKPDQVGLLLDTEIDTMELEHHKPIDVLSKTSDAMPGFGIVAAVLGIVITMGSINGPVEEIGHHVAAALVGTFLGILVSYGFLGPLAQALTFNGQNEIGFYRTLAKALSGFATGMAPMMALEVARRGLPADVKPTAEELESMLKAVSK